MGLSASVYYRESVAETWNREIEFLRSLQQTRQICQEKEVLDNKRNLNRSLISTDNGAAAATAEVMGMRSWTLDDHNNKEIQQQQK